MVDAFDTEVKLRLTVPSGEVDRVKRVVESALSKTPVGKMGGIMPMMGKGAMGMMAAGAAAGALVVSSPMLQNTLQRLLKTVMLLVRPIGDILAVGLRPIIDILRPVGLFFRILIQPYIREAMKAMRVGRQFMAAGEYGEAGKAYALGAGFLLKPFFDMMVTVTTIGVQGVLAGIKLLGSALISIVPFTEDVNRSFQGMMDDMIIGVGLGGAQIILETSVMMQTWLADLQATYNNMDKTNKAAMRRMEVVVGTGFVRIIQTATEFFVPTMKTEIQGMFDAIVNYAEEKVAYLNSLLGVQRGPWVGPRRAQTTAAPVSIATGNPWAEAYQATRGRTTPSGRMAAVVNLATKLADNINISGDADIDRMLSDSSRQIELDLRRLGLT